MKFAVTAVTMSRRTRRRVGKAKVEIVDTSKDVFYGGTSNPTIVERLYEQFWNDCNTDTVDVVKVVDVREVE